MYIYVYIHMYIPQQKATASVLNHNNNNHENVRPASKCTGLLGHPPGVDTSFIQSISVNQAKQRRRLRDNRLTSNLIPK